MKSLFIIPIVIILVSFESVISNAFVYTQSYRSCMSLPAATLFDFFQKKKSVDGQRLQLIKDEINLLAKGTSNGITASDEIRSSISNLVKELESANPTPKLSSSDKVDGAWKLIYTSNQGSSAGKLGPFVGEVEQMISLKGNDSPYYVNFVRLGGGIVEGALTATWEVISNDKWQVNFESVEFKIFGATLVQKQLSAVGIWRLTFLDDNFRILYAAGGKNVPKENIYILAK